MIARCDVSLYLLSTGPSARQGPTAGTHALPTPEFLARLLAHFPERHEILVQEGEALAGHLVSDGVGVGGESP